MDIELKTPPVENDILTLLSVAQMKENERISHSVHDDMISDHIKMAYAVLDGREGWLNRSILTQTWILYLDGWWRREIELPFGPLQSVTAVKYFDEDDVEQTLASDQYEVRKNKFVPSISKAYGVTWPTLGTVARRVSIEYVAGWGDNAAAIPISTRFKIRRALTLLASHIYRNPAATYAEPRTVAVNRTIQYGLDQTVGQLRIPPDHD